MKNIHLMILMIIGTIVVIYGVITFQWLFSASIIAVIILFMLIYYVWETMLSIKQTLEKIEQHLDVIQKNRP
jgi:hypothetical protein